MSDKTFPAQSQERQPGREHAMTPEPQYEPRFPGSGRLSGKMLLITGGDSGIGRAISTLFAREGADVAIVYLEEHDDAKKTAALVEREGRRCLLISGDVGDSRFCRDAVAKTVDTFGRIDVLINHAAEQHPKEAVEEIPEEQLLKTFRTNVNGYFFMTQAALPHMPEGSAIVNTSSVTAFRGSSSLIDYSATRGAVFSFTRALASNLLERKIRVNAVAPGPVWTPLIPSSFPPDKVESFGKSAPMGRAGQPNEIAPCHLFLACADSSYITGQVIHVNGGEIVSG